MVIIKKDEYTRFQTSTKWSSQDVLAFPGDVEKYTIRAKVKTSAEISINDYVSAVETNDDETDLKIITVTADNSIVPLFYVRDTDWNRNQLAKDNDVNDISTLNRDTAKFLANSEIDIVFLVPGAILRSKFANSQTVKPGVKVQSAGGGKLDVYGTVNARIGHILGQFESVAALKICAVMITF